MFCFEVLTFDKLLVGYLWYCGRLHHLDLYIITYLVVNFNGKLVLLRCVPIGTYQCWFRENYNFFFILISTNFPYLEISVKCHLDMLVLGKRHFYAKTVFNNIGFIFLL